MGGANSDQDDHQHHPDHRSGGPSGGRGRVEVISGVYRRKSWSPQDKALITAASFEPGARVSDVARRYDVSLGLLHHWRRKVRQHAAPVEPMFVPVRLGGADGAAVARSEGRIEIELAGARIWVTSTVDAATLSVVFAALRANS